MLSRADIPANVRVDRLFTPGIPPIIVDRDHVGQILWNLVTNAVQALSASSGSTSAQSQVLAAAQSLAQQLNATTRGIQTLRSNVEQDIGV